MRPIRGLPVPILGTMALGCALVGAPAPAAAHPHILAAADVDVVYAKTGAITAIRQRWVYDPAYSAFAKRQIGKPAEQSLTETELSSLAETQIRSLAEFGYFTNARANDEKTELTQAEDYRFSEQEGVLTLNFTLPLKAPVARGKKFSLEIHDPHFFAYFTWAVKEPVRLDGAPSGCASTTTGPQPIDLTHTRSIPAIFWAALDGSADAGRQFVNRLVVTCP